MLSPTWGYDLVQSIVIDNVSEDLGVQAFQLLAYPCLSYCLCGSVRDLQSDLCQDCKSKQDLAD